MPWTVLLSYQYKKNSKSHNSVKTKTINLKIKRGLLQPNDNQQTMYKIYENKMTEGWNNKRIELYIKFMRIISTGKFKLSCAIEIAEGQ